MDTPKPNSNISLQRIDLLLKSLQLTFQSFIQLRRHLEEVREIFQFAQRHPCALHHKTSQNKHKYFLILHFRNFVKYP